ncbi:restriction endonuclease subunit S [Sporosarcina sp. UB5]|uniref:restriction endonuclease subunit S n=1 Tax=Sporosarcina sp. UB5 TaxID=3047463 RepID=UPI003D79083C
MGFKQLKLGEICTVITDGSHSSPKAAQNGYPMLSVKDMRAFDFNYKDAKIISVEDYEKLVRNGCKPLVDDVLIAKDGNSCLEYCFVFREPKEVVLLSSIAILRPNKEIVNPFYLMYYLGMKSTIEELRQGYLSGSAIPRVVLKDFRLYPVQLPSLELQNKIVSFINAINQKIESNEIIISNAEQLAQTLFKRWFVDFEFPNENGEPYKSSGGEMVESELGLIPIGFDIKVLSDCCELRYGKALTKKNRIAGSYPVYGSGGITGTHNEYLVEGPGLILGRKGSIGTLYLEPRSFYPIDTVFYIESENYSTLFLYTLFSQLDFTKSNNDSAVPGLNRNTVYQTRLAIPNYELVNKFSEIIAPLFEEIFLLENENKVLGDLRDTLLPKLLSGEIELPDETEVIENVPVS